MKSQGWSSGCALNLTKIILLNKRISTLILSHGYELSIDSVPVWRAVGGATTASYGIELLFVF